MNRSGWVVMLNDRHSDPAFWVYDTFEEAVVKAKALLEEHRQDPHRKHWRGPILQSEEGDLPDFYWLERSGDDYYGVDCQPEGDPDISVWKANP